MNHFKENYPVDELVPESNEHLPRLLYISDVPVELSHAGSTLLYRLFEKYPPGKLRVVQTVKASRERALSVPYIVYENKFIRRLSRTRLYKFGSLLELINLGTIKKPVKQVIEEYRPQAIVAVTSRLSWISAYRVAKKYRLPLHLILHDDIITGEDHGRYLKRYIEKCFKKAYLFAASRLCISPNMEAYYYKEYKVHGEILYPMRGYKDKVASVSERDFFEKEELHFCYAGSVSTPDFPLMLNQLARVLQENQCRLTIFCDADKAMLSRFDYLMKDHVIINRFVHPDELKKFMQEEVDVNVVFNSFELEFPFRFNFSSKLVDYTAVGLPILIWGAPTSSIVSWAGANNYKCVLTDPNPEKLQHIIQCLKNAKMRSEWAMQITNLGISAFGFEVNYKTFTDSLLRSL